MTRLTQYEPENISGCMLMVASKDGRYVLKSDYDVADKKVDHLVEVVFSLQQDILNLEMRLRQKG